MEAIAEIIATYLTSYIFSGSIGIALYVLQGLGLYCIAKRRGIDHAWLAWLPVGNVWLLGAIADNYRQTARKETKNRRTAMLVLAIAAFVLVTVVIVTVIIGVINMIATAESHAYYNESVMIAKFLSVYFSSLGLLLVNSAVSIALTVLQYICLYDLYSSCEPDNKVLYLLLSIIFGLSGVFIFVCRRKDLGMQPAQAPGNGSAPQYQQPQYQQPPYQRPPYPPQYQQPPYQQPPYQRPPYPPQYQQPQYQQPPYQYPQYPRPPYPQQPQYQPPAAPVPPAAPMTTGTSVPPEET